MADPYEQAFASLRTALVDLDGDGIPDVAVPASSASDPMREINRRFPEPSPATRAGRQPVEARSAAPQGNTLLDLATMPAKAFVGQVDSAAQSLADVATSPSLANVTNAGVQNALLFGRPLAAGVVGGLGLLEAARRDYAPSIFGNSSEAQSFLNPDQQKELKDAKARISKGQFSSGAERRMLEETVKGLTKLDTDLAGAKASNDERQRADDTARKSQEDAGSRARAQAAYDAGLKTDRRFSDTAVGQVFDKLGPVAPGVVGFGTGAVTGAGMRGMGVTGKGYLYGVPAALGAIGGAFSANWPMIYDANYAPTINPSFQAAQNYVREAPEGDPRAAQLNALMRDGTIKEANPVRAKGEEELYNPVKIAERSGFGAAEGILGGIAGGEILPAARYLMRGAPQAAYELGQVPGRALRGMVDGVVTPSPRNALLTVADDPAAQALQELSAASRQAGALPPPSAAAGTGSPLGRGGSSGGQMPGGSQTMPPRAASGMAGGSPAGAQTGMQAQPPSAAVQPPALPPPPVSSGPNQSPSLTPARVQFQQDIANVLRSNVGADQTFVRNLEARPDYYAKTIPSLLRGRPATPEEQADTMALIRAVVAGLSSRNALLP